MTPYEYEYTFEKCKMYYEYSYCNTRLRVVSFTCWNRYGGSEARDVDDHNFVGYYSFIRPSADVLKYCDNVIRKHQIYMI